MLVVAGPDLDVMNEELLVAGFKMTGTGSRQLVVKKRITLSRKKTKLSGQKVKLSRIFK